MGPDDLRLLRDLLREQRIVTLAVLAHGKPVAGALPFVPAPDLSALVVHASGLAKHTAGLGDGRDWSGVVQEPDAPHHDPLATRRVMVEGTSRRIEDHQVLAAIRAAWHKRYPSAAMTVELPDFHFYSLDLHGGRLVGGFGRALNLSAEHFTRASELA